MGSYFRNLVDSLMGRDQNPDGLEEALNAAKQRGYEAAKSGRVGLNWHGSYETAESAIYRDGASLRRRSRDLVRNNPLAAKIVNTHASYFVGGGIVPRAKTGNEDLNEEINALFAEWSKVCDPEGRLDFYGQTLLEARMMVQDGEVFVRRRYRKMSDGLPVPLQFEVLDSEFCDWHRNGEMQRDILVNGIAYDKIGRRRGYWMHNQNPMSTTFLLKNGLTSNFVPERDVIHMYEPQSNQSRGAPWLAPVMVDLREVRDYEQAENVRKKTEACIVGVMIPEVGEDDPNIGLEEKDHDGSGFRDSDGNPVQRMEPGMFVVGHGGKDIRFNTPAASAGIESYLRTRHRAIASGARIPYELMTGDYSQSNFASGKLALIEYKRFVSSVQKQIIVHQGLRRKWAWFVEAAKLVGKIPMNLNVGVEWQPPEFESIDRLDDARADLAEVRMGKRSPQEIIARTGRNPEDVLEEIDTWFGKVDGTKSGLVLDSDPRKVSSVGQAHQQGGKTGDNSNAEESSGRKNEDPQGVR